MTGAQEAEDDPIARRLARSGIVLPADDLAYLRSARDALDAAREAVTKAAAQARCEGERPWPLPGRG